MGCPYRRVLRIPNVSMPKVSRDVIEIMLKVSMPKDVAHSQGEGMFPTVKSCPRCCIRGMFPTG